MDIEAMVYGGTLDASFPLPPERPFTRPAALDAGVTRRALERLVREGLVRRPVKGVYVGTHVPDSLTLRVDCLKLVAPADCVVVDRHAGWLHGAQMILAPGEHLELRPLSLFLPSGRGRLRNDLASSGERQLRDEDVVEIDGLRVTTPLRTAWDLGRVRWTDEAVTGLDAMFRLRTFGRDEFLAGIERFRRQRWVTTLRVVGPLADGRSESPGESVLRLRCIECGVRVVPQHEVWRDDTMIARLDLADPELRTGFEYDGVEWHSSPDQQRRDRERRAAVEAQGWVVHAFVAADVFGRDRACESVLQQVTRAARRRRQLPSAG